jgi:hypothetical protein
MRQAVAYETGGDAWDRILKLVNTAFREHPFNTVRAGELERWRTGGAYDLILAGTYTRRGEDGPGLKDDFADAANYYSRQGQRGDVERRRCVQSGEGRVHGRFKG